VDPVARYGVHEVDDITRTCPACGTNRRVVVALFSPQPGDYGQLEVRRRRAQRQMAEGEVG